jgi:hypothetical protein
LREEADQDFIDDLVAEEYGKQVNYGS